jgi:hypothetical protein
MVAAQGAGSNEAQDRVLGFAIFSGEMPSAPTRGHRALQKLAHTFGFNVTWQNTGFFTIGLMSRLPIRSSRASDLSNISFTVTSAIAQRVESERYLRVNITNGSASLESDYAGSVPFYYCSKGPLVVSNFMSVIEAELNSSQSDIDPAALFGFVKFGHSVWDETVWKNISAGTPSAKTFLIANSNAHPRAVEFRLDGLLDKGHSSYSSRKDSVSQLKSLNIELVQESLKDSEQIVLPLSSGLDSRLILAGISEDANLRKKTLAVTYGPKGSIEVKSAKILADLCHVDWLHLDLPLNFLSEEYLSKTSLVFASSLHMHAMYQFEFLNQLKQATQVSDKAVITTGFMTGVPSGQHITKVGSGKPNLEPMSFLEKFSQSRYWSQNELNAIFGDHAQAGDALMLKKLDSVPNVFSNNPYKQSILLDIWTRQRNFISYHPRTLELGYPVASPHMRVEWASFFMKQPTNMLWRRRLVQDLFLEKYPRLSLVPTNSENFSSLGSPVASLFRVASILLERTGLSSLVPDRFRDEQLRFDEIALSRSLPEGMKPLPNFLPTELNADRIYRALQDLNFSSGKNINAYLKLLAFQSLARSLDAVRQYLP